MKCQPNPRGWSAPLARLALLSAFALLAGASFLACNPVQCTSEDRYSCECRREGPPNEVECSAAQYEVGARCCVEASVDSSYCYCAQTLCIRHGDVSCDCNVMYVAYDMAPDDMVVDSCEGWTGGSCCLSEGFCTCDTNAGCKEGLTEVPFCTVDKLTCDISLGDRPVTDCRTSI